MMREIKDKKMLYIQLVIILCFYIFAERSIGNKSNYDLMIQGRNKMVEISKVVIEEKSKLGIYMDKKLDINNSGLIGEEFTGITTTLGDLDSKRASTNPDYAAFFIKYFKGLGLKKGDVVGINMSSSFPALNLSVIVALDLMELKGIIINSIGSSMYGANNEKLTFLELQNILRKKGEIKNSVTAYSYGGDSDAGANFDEEVSLGIKERLKDLNLELISEVDLQKNLKRRIDIYEKNGEIKCFVNVGGNIVHKKLEQYFMKKDIPVLSMLNIKQISLEHGISIEKGKEESRLYYGMNKKMYLIIVGFFIVFNIYIWNKKSRDKIS